MEPLDEIIIKSISEGFKYKLESDELFSMTIYNALKTYDSSVIKEKLYPYIENILEDTIKFYSRINTTIEKRAFIVNKLIKIKLAYTNEETIVVNNIGFSKIDGRRLITNSMNKKSDELENKKFLEELKKNNVSLDGLFCDDSFKKDLESKYKTEKSELNNLLKKEEYDKALTKLGIIKTILYNIIKITEHSEKGFYEGKLQEINGLYTKTLSFAFVDALADLRAELRKSKEIDVSKTKSWKKVSSYAFALGAKINIEKLLE